VRALGNLLITFALSEAKSRVDNDADAPVRKLGDGRPVAARDDSSALTLGMTV